MIWIIDESGIFSVLEGVRGFRFMIHNIRRRIIFVPFATRKFELITGLCMLVWSSFIFPSQVLASGFTVYEYGAEEQAQGSAVAAQVDSPSAIFYNPAGTANIPGTQIRVGSSFLFADVKFDGELSGRETEADTGPIYPTHFFATKEVTFGGIGIGFYSANGNKIEYPRNWEGRYFVVSSDLLQLNLAPAISFRIRDNIFAGISVVGSYVKIQQANQINLMTFGFPADGSANLEADGFGIGGTAGIKAIFDRWFLGVVYKSPTSVRLEGEADFQIPESLSPFFPNGDIRTNQKFPQIVIIGVANRSMRNVTLEADLQWTNWNSFNDQKIDFENQTLAVQNINIPFNWRDTWTLRLGARYDFHESFALRLGYIHDPSAVPQSTINPIFPELDKHIVTAGLGFRRNQWRADLYLARIYSKERHVDNALPGFPTHQGEYEANADAVGFSVTYAF